MNIRKTWRSIVASLAFAAFGAAAADTEITFYYPVAVGGPITKIIDGYSSSSRRRIPASR